MKKSRFICYLFRFFNVKRFLMAASVAGGLSSAFCCGQNEGDGSKPLPKGKYNIIFITTDQEVYMPSYPKESNYQAREYLRRIGTSFEKHYACSNVSTSSRSVIYTGKHITETKMLDNTNLAYQPDMDTSIKTVGDMLREAGYYTAYKGKWHISRHEDSLEDYGFSDWTEGSIYGSVWEGYHADGTIAQRSCDWLSEKGKKLNENGKPFFLAVNFINPHDIMYFCEDKKKGTFGSSLAPNEEVYRKSYPSVPVPASWDEPLRKAGRPNAHYEYKEGWDIATGKSPQNVAQWRTFRDYYFNCIQDCDNHLLRVLDHIKKLGLMENTIIVYTSDHGEMMGEHGLKGKAGNIYENNIHVPLIIYHPDYQGGRSCKNITSHLDLAPTLVDMATNDQAQAEQIKEGIKGYSLMPAVHDTDTDIRNKEGALFVYDMIAMMDAESETVPDGKELSVRVDLNKRGYLRGIITADYKFARYFSPIRFNTPEDVDSLYAHNDVELYAMGSDECNNLAYPKGNNADRVIRCNDALNALIKKEIGVDDGRETAVFRGGILKYAK